MTTSMTHVAGLAIDVEGYVRQRCAWCSQVILEYDLSYRGNHPAPANGYRAPSTWDAGTLVRLLDDAGSMRVEQDPADPAPEDACLRLSPEATYR